MGSFKIPFIAIFFIILLPGCMYAVRFDGPYKGKIVDAETREPIEGVVVLGVWYTAQFSPAGSTHRFYDASETVTDKNGEFRMSGKGPRVLSNLEPINITVFKTGYEYFRAPWESLQEAKSLKEIIKWEGDKVIMPLRKLTMTERKNRIVSTPNIPYKKMQLLTREVNKEDFEAKGFSPKREIEIK